MELPTFRAIQSGKDMAKFKPDGDTTNLELELELDMHRAVRGSHRGDRHYLCPQQAVGAEHKLKCEAVLLLKTFVDDRAVLYEGVTEEDVATFVSSESLPLVVDINQDTAKKIFSGEIKS